jgi:hypothetical protein
VPTSETNPKVNCNANIGTDGEATDCFETSMPVAKYRGELAVRWSKTERKKEVTEGCGTQILIFVKVTSIYGKSTQYCRKIWTTKADKPDTNLICGNWRSGHGSGVKLVAKF